MSTASRNEITQLLAAATAGDARASAELLPLVYDELRKLARARMGKEPSGGSDYTLQPTALVHEAYLRLVGNAEIKWDGRGHFFAAAARAMRRILVERARHRGRAKHGGGMARVEFQETMAVEPPPTDLLALDAVLEKLDQFDPRKCDVVMMRYFAGLSIEDTAAALGVSATTVKNDWLFAKAWLHRELARTESDEPAPGEIP